MPDTKNQKPTKNNNSSNIDKPIFFLPFMKFIDQHKAWVDEHETQALLEFMQGGTSLSEGKKTKLFAKNLAEYTQTPFCSIYANGTMTLVGALMALGITQKEDEVIVPAYTMIATANAVVMAGATPIFADVERETICLDFENMKAQITPRTKAIMLVSINGRYPKQIDAILEYCKKHKIFVIEDAAQSLGSWYKGKHIGSYGCMGSFSFSMPKIITTGQGGALITSNQELYRNIKLVKNFGREKDGTDKQVFYGVNFKFTDIQAVIGIEQLKKLPLRVTLKRRNYKMLQERLHDIEEIEFIDTPDEITPWFNDIIVPDVVSLQNFLKDNGIGTRHFYPALHTQKRYGQTDKSCPNVDFFVKKGICLPSHAQLTEEELEKVINTVRKFYKK